MASSVVGACVSLPELMMLLLLSSSQLRREVRLRREYLYRKAQENRLRTIEEKKEKLKGALEGGGAAASFPTLLLFDLTGGRQCKRSRC